MMDPEFAKEALQDTYQHSKIGRIELLNEELQHSDLKETYRLIEEINKGGMGVVYRAEQDNGEKKQVAIKFLHLDGKDNPSLQQRFQQEIKTLSALDHPNIISILDHGKTKGGYPFLVMPLLKGKVLDTRRWFLEEIAPIMTGLCEGFQYVHDQGILHRDIKLSNIFITEEGQPVILDFGIAKNTLAPGSGTLTGMTPGTNRYLAPELLKGERASPQSDVYALGVVLYQLLSGGEFPEGVFPKPSQMPPNPYPSWLDEIVNTSLAQQPEKRYKRPAELAAALTKMLNSSNKKATAMTATDETITYPEIVVTDHFLTINGFDLTFRTTIKDMVAILGPFSGEIDGFKLGSCYRYITYFWRTLGILATWKFLGSERYFSSLNIIFQPRAIKEARKDNLSSSQFFDFEPLFFGCPTDRVFKGVFRVNDVEITSSSEISTLLNCRPGNSRLMGVNSLLSMHELNYTNLTEDELFDQKGMLLDHMQTDPECDTYITATSSMNMSNDYGTRRLIPVSLFSQVPNPNKTVEWASIRTHESYLPFKLGEERPDWADGFYFQDAGSLIKNAKKIKQSTDRFGLDQSTWNDLDHPVLMALNNAHRLPSALLTAKALFIKTESMEKWDKWPLNNDPNWSLDDVEPLKPSALEIAAYGFWTLLFVGASSFWWALQLNKVVNENPNMLMFCASSFLVVVSLAAVWGWCSDVRKTFFSTVVLSENEYESCKHMVEIAIAGGGKSKNYKFLVSDRRGSGDQIQQYITAIKVFFHWVDRLKSYPTLKFPHEGIPMESASSNPSEAPQSNTQLSTCPTCGSSISKSAMDCPQCGEKLGNFFHDGSTLAAYEKRPGRKGRWEEHGRWWATMERSILTFVMKLALLAGVIWLLFSIFGS